MRFNLTPGLVPDDNLFVSELPAAFQLHAEHFPVAGIVTDAVWARLRASRSR
jgi:hypothetical protein